MGTEVLRLHHILEAPVPALATCRNPNPEPHRKPPCPTRPEAKRARERSPKPAKGRFDRPAAGKGAILRPGEAEVYAGSGFTNSPAPSALPLPRFSLKKDAPAVAEHLATMALRRMLRLE